MKNILSIVHFPKDVGGRQFSGLSRVMFNISNEMGDDKNINYVTISTDKLFGGNYKFINYGIISPIVIFTLIKKAIHIKRFYKLIKEFYPEGLSFKQMIQYIVVNSFSSLKKWDIIHIHSIDHGFVCKCKDYNTKIIYTNHGVIADDKNINNFLNIQNRERLVSRINLDFMVFVSEGARAKWSSFYGPFNCGSSVISNAIDNNFWKVL